MRNKNVIIQKIIARLQAGERLERAELAKQHNIATGTVELYMSIIRQRYGILTTLNPVTYEMTGKDGLHCPRCGHESGKLYNGVSKCANCGALNLDSELKTMSKLPCGHPQSDVVQADEWTCFCGACADEARYKSHYAGEAI